MAELDPRLLRIGIEVNSEIKYYEGLAMVASGCKYANANQNECEVKITNIDKATRDYILTESSPFNKNHTRKSLIVEAGRVSTGYALVYEGDIMSSNVSQPPDITLTIKTATGNFHKGKVIARAHGKQTSAHSIAQGVAKDLGLNLQYEATDQQVSNYSFTGGALKQVEALGQHGRVNAYVDDKVLVVKNYNAPLANQQRDLDLESGLIGIPEFTEQGIKVKMLFDNQTKLGTALNVTSRINPAANGLYTVYKLNFELASRDTAWYYTAECTRYGHAAPAKR